MKVLWEERAWADYLSLLADAGSKDTEENQ